MENQLIPMGYLHDIDAWLSDILKPLPEEERDRAKKGIKTKILESYRNGAKASQKDSREQEARPRFTNRQRAYRR